MKTETLWSPQTVISLALLAIGAATIGGVFYKSDPATINTIAGIVIGSTLGSVSGFFLGSSKGSQEKDRTLSRIARGDRSGDLPP